MLTYSQVASRAEAIIHTQAEKYHVRGIPLLDRDSLISLGREVCWDTLLAVRDRKGLTVDDYGHILISKLRFRILDAIRRERFYQGIVQPGTPSGEVAENGIVDLSEIFADQEDGVLDQVLKTEAMEHFLADLSPMSLRIFYTACYPPQELLDNFRIEQLRRQRCVAQGDVSSLRHRVSRTTIKEYLNIPKEVMSSCVHEIAITWKKYLGFLRPVEELVRFI